MHTQVIIRMALGITFLLFISLGEFAGAIMSLVLMFVMEEWRKDQKHNFELYRIIEDKNREIEGFHESYDELLETPSINRDQNSKNKHPKQTIITFDE